MTDETQTNAELVEPVAEPALTPAPEVAAVPETAPEPAPAAPEPLVAEVEPAPEVPAVPDRTDGPTLKEWVEHGYAEEAYPPTGYAVRDEAPVNLNALRGVQHGPAPHPRTG